MKLFHRDRTPSIFYFGSDRKSLGFIRDELELELNELTRTILRGAGGEAERRVDVGVISSGWRGRLGERANGGSKEERSASGGVDAA
jgi:hypothetical protein